MNHELHHVRYLIIHCSATRCDRSYSLAALRRQHVDINRWDDIGYHYYITRDGTVHTSRPSTQVGAHCHGHNHESLGICYEGGLLPDGRPADTRTEAQKESLQQLLLHLKALYPGASIKGHYEMGAKKACPCFCASAAYKNL